MSLDKDWQIKRIISVSCALFKSSVDKVRTVTLGRAMCFTLPMDSNVNQYGVAMRWSPSALHAKKSSYIKGVIPGRGITFIERCLDLKLCPNQQVSSKMDAHSDDTVGEGWKLSEVKPS